MPTLSQVSARTKSLTVEWGSTPIKIEYKPGKLTGNLVAEVEQNADVETIGTVLIDLIDTWDLTEDDGVTMFPLDIKRFGEIGLPVLTTIFYAMVTDLRPEALAPQMTNSKT